MSTEKVLFGFKKILAVEQGSPVPKFATYVRTSENSNGALIRDLYEIPCSELGETDWTKSQVNKKKRYALYGAATNLRHNAKINQHTVSIPLHYYEQLTKALDEHPRPN